LQEILISSAGVASYIIFLVKIIYAPEYLDYKFGEGHPFWPERAKKFISLLEKNNFSYSLVDAPRASDQDILLVHSKEYLKKLKEMVKTGGGYISVDTPVSKSNFNASYHYVGGTIKALNYAIKEELSINLLGGLHHAERDKSSGFCIFNDHAIAIRKLQKEKKIKTAAVLDLDVHAGNGTQEIFYDDPMVLTASIHQDPSSFYPGTGFSWQMGVNRGKGYNVNYPLGPGTGEEEYLEALDTVIQKIEAFEPDVLAVVFGADTYKDDPLASFKLELGSYERIAERLGRFQKKAILFAGGYSKTVPEIWYRLVNRLI
jgi:acetoin utilization protein AcuC